MDLTVENVQDALTNKKRTKPTTTNRIRNRIRTILLLYISYILNIYLLWTNCVIFAVAVQKLDMNGINKISNLLQYQNIESNIDSNLEQYPSHSFSKQIIVTNDNYKTYLVSATGSNELKIPKRQQIKKVKCKTKYLHRNDFNPNWSRFTRTGKQSIGIRRKRNVNSRLTNKHDFTQNVIRNVIFRVIKRNVNNFTNNLLANNSIIHKNVSVSSTMALSPIPNVAKLTDIINVKSTSTMTTESTKTSLSFTTNSIQTTSIAEPLSNTKNNQTLSHNPLTNNATQFWFRESNHTVAKQTNSNKTSVSTRRPFSSQQLNRFKVNNVFEMDTKRKYNKNSKNSLLERNQSEKGIVSLLGLFELSTRFGLRPDGHSELAAAQMAVRHINKRNLLPDYTLQLLTNDTMVSNFIVVLVTFL